MILLHVLRRQSTASCELQLSQTMINTTIALMAIAFQFAGGRDSDLAKEIAKVEPSQSVILLADPERIWKPYRHDFDTKNGLFEVVGKKYAVKIAADQPTVSVGAYPQTVAFYNSDPVTQLQDLEEPNLKEVKSCEVPFATKGSETLSMKQVEQLLPGYSVKFHWFYRPARFAVSSRGMSPEAFIAAIAKTLGAKAKVEAKSVDFAPDYKELRKRVRLSISAKLESETDAWNLADYTFLDATWEAATLKQIEAAFADQDKVGEQIAIRPGSRLESLLQRRIQVRMDPKTSSPAEISKWQEWLANLIDVKQPASATLSPLMNPSATLSCQKPKTYFQF